MSALETFDRYTLLRKLATGGMAEVFLARVQGPAGFEKVVVLKKILPELARDQVFTRMFMDEARLAATFSHPNVAQVFDFGEVNGTWYLTMEYVDGPTLRQVKKRAATHNLALPPDVVAGIIARACEGLHYVHELKDPDTGVPRELIHRDISPDNLILSRNGQVKVLDFGIVKSTSLESYTRSGSVRGKLAYMPPEQISAEPLDRRVDVWALGMVLYELLTLRRPYEAQQDAAVMKAILFEPFIPLLSLRPDVPKGLVDIVNRCLSKNRDERYPNAREVQGALEKFIAREGHAIGSYEIENFVRELSEGRAPKEGAATIPAGLPALKPGERPPSIKVPVAPPPQQPPAQAPTVIVSELSTIGGTVTEPEPTRRQPSRFGRIAAIAVVVLGALGFGAWKLNDGGPTPTSVVDAGVPVVAPPLPVVVEVDAGFDAGVVEEVVDAGVVIETPPPVVVDAGVAGKKKLPPPAAKKPITVEVRVLPEGEALISGSNFTVGKLTQGAHKVTFKSKRFGEVSRSLDVPPCEGKVLVGYSFSSDRLSVSCKP